MKNDSGVDGKLFFPISVFTNVLAACLLMGVYGFFRGRVSWHSGAESGIWIVRILTVYFPFVFLYPLISFVVGIILRTRGRISIGALLWYVVVCFSFVAMVMASAIIAVALIRIQNEGL